MLEGRGDHLVGAVPVVAGDELHLALVVAAPADQHEGVFSGADQNREAGVEVAAMMLTMR